jgi:hypothetical protein
MKKILIISRSPKKRRCKGILWRVRGGGIDMVLPEEMIGGKRTRCPDCNEKLELDVYRSAAGYYVGFWCDRCGPISRESGYYKEREDAQKEMAAGVYFR